MMGTGAILIIMLHKYTWPFTTILLTDISKTLREQLSASRAFGTQTKILPIETYVIREVTL